MTTVDDLTFVFDHRLPNAVLLADHVETLAARAREVAEFAGEIELRDPEGRAR